MTKQIYTYSRGNIDTGGSDMELFTGGYTGLIFTKSTNIGLTLKMWSEGDDSIVPVSGSIVGLGLGYGDKLFANGVGSLAITFWGELESIYRIVNTDELEVLVGGQITFGQSGNALGGLSISSNVPVWVKPGIYADRAYSLNSSNQVTW